MQTKPLILGADGDPGKSFEPFVSGGSTNKTQVHSMCTESGIWQTVQFSCIFDPLAISLEEGSLLEGK